MIIGDNKYDYFSLSDTPVASILWHLTVDTNCVGLDSSVYKLTGRASFLWGTVLRFFWFALFDTAQSSSVLIPPLSCAREFPVLTQNVSTPELEHLT